MRLERAEDGPIGGLTSVDANFYVLLSILVGLELDYFRKSAG